MLTDWINDVLVEERIIVKQLDEDLYDGQVLQKLLGERPQPPAGHGTTLRVSTWCELDTNTHPECAPRLCPGIWIGHCF